MNSTPASHALPTATTDYIRAPLLVAASLALLALVFLTATPARASDPVGIYGLVTKVVMEPSEGAPERIQVHGVFAVAVGRGINYTNPQAGVLYFKLNPEKKDHCLREWNDLKTQAGKKEVVGFGLRYADKQPTIRKMSEKLETPDAYEMGIGIQRARQVDSARSKSPTAPSRSPRGPSQVRCHSTRLRAEGEARRPVGGDLAVLRHGSHFT